MVLTDVVPDSIEWSETWAECSDSVLSHIEILLVLTAVFDGWSMSFVDTPCQVPRLGVPKTNH
jgi:hypothetical protein